MMVNFKNNGYFSVDGDGNIIVHEREQLARKCR